MKHRRFLVPATLLALNGALLWGAPSHAALGGDAASIAADRIALSGELSLTDAPPYRIQEISTASGFKVREYRDTAGVVFAVSWSGPAVPDLAQLLGAYYGEYLAALLNHRPTGLQRTVSITGPNIKVELAGHMRAYSGLAYLPAKLPANMSIGQLR